METAARKSLEERFWEKVRKGPGCWSWTAATHQFGYGKIRYRKTETMWEAHRLAWTLRHGPIPKGVCVLHRCDEPGCTKTEPDDEYPEGHLFLGTKGDNSADMAAKGRSTRGEKHPQARLSEADVHRIRRLRASGVRARQIAVEYGIHWVTAHAIISGRNWSHVV
jgi:hypothetical protein